ncbi:MAG: hypothetical protein LUC17_01315 [Oscillospiraceae bacterium]|nr:hypothetical protein [Oscillospiraceae bacterium]
MNIYVKSDINNTKLSQKEAEKIIWKSLYDYVHDIYKYSRDNTIPEIANAISNYGNSEKSYSILTNCYDNALLEIEELCKQHYKN